MKKRPSPAQVISINSGDHRARVTARRDQLVTDNLSLAEGIARKIARQVPPCFELQDLIATANLALLRAATSYRPGVHGGTPFSAYARIRVHGAVLDSIRRNRWIEATRPGILVTQMNEAGEQLEQESPALCRAATQPVAPLAIDRRRERQRVIAAASWLPVEQQRVVDAYYSQEEPTLAEVGRQLGISEGAAKKLHSIAIATLRGRLKAA